jgi:cysteine desulfurase / selenocysteine lyase
MSPELIYLDNAATSWPKPPTVVEAMSRFLNQVGATPGRSGHRLSVEAAREVYLARELAAQLFGLADPLRLVFTSNATSALNLAMEGLLRPGDHVVTSGMEHNSVMRPLNSLQARGTHYSVAPCSDDGQLEPRLVEEAIRDNTTMVILNHASNVTGGLLPIAQIGAVARQRGLLLLVDAAQTAGCHPIDMQADCIDLLAFTGHKSLLGPQGTGGLAIGDRVDLDAFTPLTAGGTGSRSEYEEQPRFLPDRFESGTPNAVGIVGLAAGLRFVLKQGIENTRALEMGLRRTLTDGLKRIPGVTVHGPKDDDHLTSALSFTVEGLSPSEIGFALDDEFGICCRVGLHCAPRAHRTIGTAPQGTVRLSPGCFNSTGQMVDTVEAVARIVDEARGK